MDEEEWVGYDGGAVQDRHRSARRIFMAPGEMLRSYRDENTDFYRELVASVGQEDADKMVAEAVDETLKEEGWVEYDGGAVQDRHQSASRILMAPGVTEIPRRAFRGCEDLMAVDLGNVTTISDDAFAGCRSLERVVWSTASAVEIGNLAFYHCTSLVRIKIPSSVTDIEKGAFKDCSSLEEVELNEGLKHIGDEAFYQCKSLRSISIPSTTVNIGDRAFEECEQLRRAVFKEGLQTIGGEAFFLCQSLEHITIPSSIRLVGYGAFESCRSLSDVTLREGVHCIEGGAFRGCTSLGRVNIPPVAFVIDVRGSVCQLMRTTTAMPATLQSKLVVSKWMQYRSPSQLEQAGTKVNEILGRQQTVEEKIRAIRELFAYYYRLDATTMLELAIWRANLDNNERDAEARLVRDNCGSDMNVIIPSVLPFLGATNEMEEDDDDDDDSDDSSSEDDATSADGDESDFDSDFDDV